jgi:fatty acid desaturase
MFPRVPHYNLPPLFDEIRPHLEANGARIEGPLAGPGAPKIRMR